MKAMILVLTLLLATTNAVAQWRTVGFSSDYPVLTFAIHDSVFYAGYPNLNQFFEDALVYRFNPPSSWQDADSGIDRSQGSVTSFATLGRLFFAGLTYKNGANIGVYSSSDDGKYWKTPVIAGPIASNGRYLFGSILSSVGPAHVRCLERSTDTGKTWDSVATIGQGGNFSSILTDGACILAANNTNLLRSTDEGATWSQIAPPVSIIQSFAVVDSLIYAANMQLMRSSDSGLTWSLVPISFSVHMLATDGKRLFAATDKGVFMLDTDGSTWVDESGSEQGKMW